ncbi:4Fe-4S ferredoxin iron-sulfur binding domain protein [Ignisphaera aggregans DSM 17230]|uniref:4Fe-4S ferredoxin iron-sulfur binding domain protein n=1 Tax=Ignisphaera aggregans (strain DSM 17230 / JCM 13409 / AQ1.S1) TaxID=583356 RepID=E0SQ26_IGNAA|nr:4Fe-4S ferredoxin iron-sulfur binding domain protein [Ignisphaera aggregans DSM 17230]
MKRLIVSINRERCIGCGKCVEACLAKALAIIDGRAMLINERMCDGFGSCIAVCPSHAIELVYREAEPFDNSILRSLTLDKLLKNLELTSRSLLRNTP